MKEIGTKTLETNRLILRKFKVEDAENMYKNWASDPNTCKYVSFEPHKDINVTKNVISKWIKEYENCEYNWVIELKDTHEIIGNISVVNMKKKEQYCELGYAYGSKYWGNGYATEALRKVIEFLLNDCEFNLVEAKHITTNPASERVMQKAGMKKEAVLRQRRICKTNGGFDDLVIYSIMKSEL